MNYHVTAVYFSPTDTSRKGVCAIAKTLDGTSNEIDLTCHGENAKFGSNDVVVFGAPVYGGRLFKGFVERLSGIQGDKTPCVITVTYGNRDYDDALLEMHDLVIANGFVPIAAAALIGQHTYGSIQVGRPNKDDLDEDVLFAEKIVNKLKSGDFSIPDIPGNRPYREGGNGGSFIPLTNDNCVNCGNCVAECPMQAIGADNRTIKTDKCIACFRCIRRCPVSAKHIDIPAYNEFAAMFTEKLKAPKSNIYFL